jgi:hypothetical protein
MTKDSDQREKVAAERNRVGTCRLLRARRLLASYNILLLQDFDETRARGCPTNVISTCAVVGTGIQIQHKSQMVSSTS